MASGPVVCRIYLIILGSFLYKNWGFIFERRKYGY
nr:MAG TPA: hypothetical protein [Caudoviricetes sp.]